MFNKYVNSMLARVEGTPAEIQELTDEVTGYLEEKKSSYQAKGFSDKEAELKAIKDFGDTKKIGNKLGYTIFPQRRWLIDLQLIFSILFFIISLGLNGIEGFKNGGLLVIGWVIINLAFIINNFVFRRNKILIARYRTLFLSNCLLGVLALFYTMPIYWDFGTSNLIILGRLILIAYVLVIISNMVFGALLKPVHSNFSKLSLTLRVFSILSNTISGFMVFVHALIMLLGILIFGSMVQLTFYHAIPTILVGVWVVSVIMNNYINKNFGLGILIQIVLTLYTMKELWLIMF